MYERICSLIFHLFTQEIPGYFLSLRSLALRGVFSFQRSRPFFRGLNTELLIFLSLLKMLHFVMVFTGNRHSSTVVCHRRVSSIKWSCAARLRQPGRYRSCMFFLELPIKILNPVLFLVLCISLNSAFYLILGGSWITDLYLLPLFFCLSMFDKIVELFG